MSERLILLGIVLSATSGFPGLFMSRWSTIGQWVATVLALVGGALGLAGVGAFWVWGEGWQLLIPMAIPLADLEMGMDGLSAIFLVPVFLISLLGSVYGLTYWKQTEHPGNGRKLSLFYGLMTAGMALLVIAQNSILFLIGWEIMALSAFLLVTTEDEHPIVRETGWIYIVATHFSTLCLFGLFAILRTVCGTFSFIDVPEGKLTPEITMAIFILALVGFGLKAGLMPFHIWLPGAHAVAPSHVSALMSGVIIKMGVYGLIRILSLFSHPPLEWGGILLGMGAVSGILGVAFAIGQHDLKRLLAYHSIENIGIIFMGIGLALVGKSLLRAEWVILGLSGALLHVWNHALFKALLFLGAGSVIHAVDSREIDHLGGLARLMPRTALCFLIGAVAICGLPPLNGFVSEFLIYLGLFDTLGISGGPSFPAASLAVPALALIGALAVACFVKVFGVAFLGSARSEAARRAHESGFAMIGPMAILVACCFGIGLAPAWVAPILGKGVSAWAPELKDPGSQLASLAPLGWISTMGMALVAAMVLASGVFWFFLLNNNVVSGHTWGCGYLTPNVRMQYTSSSFAQMLVGLFAWVLHPRIHSPHNLDLFPKKAHFKSEVPDAVLDEVLHPVFRFGAWLFSWFRVFQQGNIQAYLLYIFLALIALLFWR